MASVLDWIVDKVDTLALWLLPPSLLGALFGDAFRKDLLTPRQRLAAFALTVMLSPLAGMAAGKEWGWHPYTCGVITTLAAALGVDLIALAVAVVREFRTDPWAASGKTADAIKRIADALLSFVPWRTK
ncbi:hypothetical protein [uncultured Reyranella sp.]|jgi:hypothetical protein|uniref:hypothetical protein n=1 Tax=uncultured Reyranella sp. TaxID=735512 RepID=UPI00259CE7D6|nr:hypothetical protein [uncultured Reyranella sp.]